MPADLPGWLKGFGQPEEQRFRGLLDRGHEVLARFEPGRQLTEKDLAYLHETHGLRPELVTELLASRAELLA